MAHRFSTSSSLFLFFFPFFCPEGLKYTASPHLYTAYLPSFFYSRAKQRRRVYSRSVLHSLATGWEGDSLTLENEDVVAMGTVNPSVTQRVPGWWDAKSNRLSWHTWYAYISHREGSPLSYACLGYHFNWKGKISVSKGFIILMFFLYLGKIYIKFSKNDAKA